jgi:AcrR family transcriptional regulator
VTVSTRTQEERRAETRSKLLDATVSSIAERGLAATTSRVVCELAGVSSGAQTHHFPLRTDLLSAAVEHVAEQGIAALRATVPDLPQDRRQRLEVLLDVWWGNFNSPTFDVFVKLWVAAQDDPELHARLVPVEQRLAEAISSLSVDVMGDADSPELQARLPFAIAALRGLALMEHFEPRARRRRDPWPDMRKQLLETLLAPPRS